MDGSIDSPTNDPVDCDPQAPTDAAANDRPDHRMQRIGDYLNEALNSSNALAANLGAQNSSLMKMGYRMQQTIENAMEEGPMTLDDLENLMPTIESYLKISKQVDHFSRLCIKLDEVKAVTLPLASNEPERARSSEDFGL